jgi:hypothetical protein
MVLRRGIKPSSPDNIAREVSKALGMRELLAPVYGWLTEGFDARDLKEANARLEELVS